MSTNESPIETQEALNLRSKPRSVAGSLFPGPFLIVTATAFAMVLPFLFLGNPSGHDFEFHMNSWMEVASQRQQGILYPRWAALAHYGYGDTRFIFYPPASWLLGGSLGRVLPWKGVPGTYVWLVLTLSGCSMFLLARCWLNRRDSILAAALYSANPYYIVIVYWRSAFAELLAGALLPLLLLYLLRLEEERGRAVVPLGLIVAAACLTNVPASVMVNYSLALLAVMIAIMRRSPRLVLHAALAALIGAAVAAFYLVPAYYEQKWINIGEAFAPGLRPQDNFLFNTIDNADHDRFNRLVSFVASAEIVALAVAIFLARGQRRKYPRVWYMLLVWTAVSVLLMFPFALPLWRHLPLLPFAQQPWRWLLCLNMIFALFVVMAWRRWIGRVSAYIAMLAMLAVAAHYTQPPWWDNASEIAKLARAHQTGAGYQGTDEYVPAGGDAYDVRQDASLVALDSGDLQLQAHRWSQESKSFTVQARRPGNLILRLFNYPAWQVKVNGRATEAEPQEDTGQMLIPVQAGQSEVLVNFTRTWDRTAGGIVSLITVVSLAGWWLRRGLARKSHVLDFGHPDLIHREETRRTA